MVSYRFELNPRPNRNKKYNILLCITIAGKRKRITTDIFLNRKSDINSKGRKNNWVRESEPNSKVWNEALAVLLEDVRKKYREQMQNDGATAENVAHSVRGGEQSKVFFRNDNGVYSGFAYERTQYILDTGGVRNWKKHNGFLNKLADFLDKKMKHKKELLFSDVTLELVTKFDAYLRTLRNSRTKTESDKMLHPNTIAVVLSIFKRILRKGIELGYTTPDKNPFIVFKCASIKTEKEKLTASEIQSIIELDLPVGSNDWHSRNCFLFSFYCAGIRAGDLLQLRWLNVEEGRLMYQMGKNHKIRNMKLVPQALAILDLYRTDSAKSTDYIFPFMNNRKVYADAVMQSDRDVLPTELKQKMVGEISAKNALINKSLKRIAQKAGIEKKVSMHISRHSFASIAMQKGVESQKVKSLLAHSRLETTEVYMGNFSTDESDKALASIFGNPVDEKAKLLELIQNMNAEQVKTLLSAINH